MIDDLYDKDGTPLTREEFWAKHTDLAYKTVAATEVGESRVSTVWLGRNHAYTDDTPPILFETMIFDGPHDEAMWRYETEDEATAGHAAVVNALRDGTDLP